MSSLSDLHNDVVEVFVGHNCSDIMSVLTAVTASVLHESLQDGKTLDDAMAVFKMQVQYHLNRLNEQGP